MECTRHNRVFSSDLLKGKNVLITGGGTGIGLEVAIQAAETGASGIAICGRRLEPLQRAKLQIEKIDPQKGMDRVRVIYSTCDIRDSEMVEKFVQFVKDSFGTLDILINNAGGQFPINAENLSSKGFEAVVKNNLVGTWNMIKSVATIIFIPQKRGSIVNVIAQIRNGFPGMVHTGAARAGVDNLTKTLAVEWSHFGIRINSVAPGVIITSGTDQYPPQLIERSTATTPLKRAGNAEEVSVLIIYLGSDASSFVTGQTYYIDGGQSLTSSFHSDSWTKNARSSKL